MVFHNHRSSHLCYTSQVISQSLTSAWNPKEPGTRGPRAGDRETGDKEPETGKPGNRGANLGPGPGKAARLHGCTKSCRQSAKAARPRVVSLPRPWTGRHGYDTIALRCRARDGSTLRQRTRHAHHTHTERIYHTPHYKNRWGKPREWLYFCKP